MAYNLLADLVVLIHFTFVLFSVLGALLVIRWRRVLWIHLPAVFWAAWIEFSGRICPLTPLENWLRLKSGQPAYSGDFIGHYILPLLYPAGLTREVQIILGAIVVGLNIILYGYVFRRSKRGPGGSGKKASRKTVS